MIQLIDVSKVYDNGVRALDHVNIRIQTGRRTVLSGPSGCGKTTLLRMIAGLEPVTEGSIIQDDVHRISFMFQDDKLFDEISVERNIAYGSDQGRISKEILDRKVDEIARLTGAVSFIRQKTSTLSGGQRQRVALARALIKEPDLLMIDEGFNNLDRASKEEMVRLVISLQEKLRFTLLYVTHDEEEAALIGEDIVHL